MDRANNFDFIRFVAAALVFFQHSFLLYGLAPPAFIPLTEADYSYTYGSIGITVFFIVSGFLITASWQRIGRGLPFMRNRVLRLYPALAVTYLFGLFLIGPLSTSLPMTDYLRELLEKSPSYASLFLLMMPFPLPGVFESNPVPHVVNAPLWTLGFEFAMYIFVLVLGTFDLLRRCRFAVILFLWACLFVFGVGYDPSNKPLIYCFSFVLGSVFYLWRDRIRFTGAGALLCLLAQLFIVFYALPPSLAMILHVVTLPYLIIGMAFSPRVRLARFAARGDFSYGMYIYAYPIQQLVSQYGRDDLDFLTYTVVCFALTLAMAALSWHLVEKRCLARKV